MPFVVGANADETSRDTPRDLTEEEYNTIVLALFGLVDGLRVLQQYPLSDFESPWAAYTRLTTDLRFVCTSIDIARTAASGQIEPVYRFFFTESIAREGGIDFGAFHGLELFFVFGNLDLGFFSPDAAEESLSRSMQGYWSSFATDGDPDNGNEPTWEPYVPERDNTLILEGGAIRQQDDVRADYCAFWWDLFGADLSAIGKLVARTDPRAIIGYHR